MNRKLPSIAMLLGIGGLIPFIVCGLGALANPPPNDELSLMALIAYGAVILAFLGGVHWGFGLDEAGTAPSDIQRARFGLGVLPVADRLGRAAARGAELQPGRAGACWSSASS